MPKNVMEMYGIATMARKPLGNRIRRLRLERNLLQRELASMIFVENYTIGDWERNRSEPDVENLRKLCVVFNVSADELLEVETAKERDMVYINRDKLI